jgi:hypothetical protein
LAVDLGKVVITFGKYKMREVYALLTERGISRKVGIRDSDFLRIPGNTKFVENFSDHIFPTDGHDSEIMMLNSGVIKNFLDLISDEEKVASFENKIGCDVTSFLFSMARRLGYLRLTNKRKSLGLSFKPEKPEGNELRIDRFVCDKTWTYLGDEKMINTVVEYSKNRGNVVASREVVAKELKVISNEIYPDLELVNGHDVSYILLMVAKSGLRSSSKLLQDADCVEDILASYFDWLKFSSTTLFSMIDRWQGGLPERVFVPS